MPGTEVARRNAGSGDGTLLMEGAQIIFRNFTGKEGMYNAEGDRNFCVLLDDDLAAVMRNDGWNIKHLKVREEGEEPQAYIQVSVKYRGKNGQPVKPPAIVMITSKGRTALTEEEAEILDWVDIANVDLIVRPYAWTLFPGTPQQKSGIKAYLKSLYITIQEDALQLKYADVPEIGGSERLAIESGHDDVIDVEWEEIDPEALPARAGAVD